MSRKIKTNAKEKASRTHRGRKPEVQAEKDLAQQASLSQFLMQAFHNPSTLTPSDIIALQQTAGNRAVEGILRESAIQSSTPMNSVQRKTEEEVPLQGKFETPRKEGNSTGLPDDLKAGIENLSGISLDDVKVHYNSSKPAEVQALAYTKGTDIYIGPGQEKHLPHEAWHVVQQKSGRVKPTLQAKGIAINDDAGLEKEADAMGMKSAQMNLSSKDRSRPVAKFRLPVNSIIQRIPPPPDHIIGAYDKDFDKKHLSTTVNKATAAEIATKEGRTVKFNTVLKDSYIWGKITNLVTAATKADKYKYADTAKSAGDDISIAELKKKGYRQLDAPDYRLYSFSVFYSVADQGAKKKVTLYHLECP